MAIAWNASLTDDGVSMISRWAQGQGDMLTITGAVIGEGIVVPSLLHTLTQLIDEKSPITIQDSESIANGIKLKLNKTSQGITTGFTLNQIGIYAKLDTSGGAPVIAETLIAIYQQDTGILIPTEAETPDFVFTFYATIQTNYSGDLKINVDTSALLTQNDIADDLVTADASMALSANMGKYLNENKADLVGGRVPYSQLPESAMEFKGTWNASTNTPAITQGVGTNGDFYVVSTGGTWNNITFNANDRILFDGSANLWIRLVGETIVSGTQGDFLAIGSGGVIADSGKKASDFSYTNGAGLNLAGNSFSVKYGTAEGTACQGNDSRLSNSRPASDVYAWAKAASKPSYNASEIGAGTLAGRVQANGTAMATLGNAQVRDIYAGTSDMTAGTSNLTTGTIYLVYEA